MTKNTIEGFHGLSLMYCDKRTDMGHNHYICKSNMGICHKVYLGVNVGSGPSTDMLICRLLSSLKLPLLLHRLIGYQARLFPRQI